MKTVARARFWMGLLLLTPLTSGCANEAAELDSPTAVRLRGLAIMIMDFSVAKGHGPADEKELRKHLRAVEGFVLEMNGLDPKDVDASFISLRDQQPFVVRWGVGLTVAKSGVPVLAYEKTGKDDKRLVAFANGKLELVENARFQELIGANS